MNLYPLEALREYMQMRTLDAFLVTDIVHVRYLTGFSGSAGICVVTKKSQYFFTDNRYKDQAPKEVKNFTIAVAPTDLFETLKDKQILHPSMTVGIEASNISLEMMAKIKRLFPLCRFLKTTKVLETISAIKQPNEMKLLRKAAAITDEVFKKVLPLIKPGVCECDIAAEISYWHRRLGAEGDAFEPIVASGPRAALPHARASKKKIKNREMVVLDFGCRYNGYHSDLTRTVAIGTPTKEMKHIYTIVAEAQQRALDALRVGQKAQTIDSYARTHIQNAGYGIYFFHSLGHGLGIRIHEPLRLSANSNDVLEEGNVFTVEPGIYVPTSGGVRIEDDVILHKNSVEIITHSPKELIVL